MTRERLKLKEIHAEKTTKQITSRQERQAHYYNGMAKDLHPPSQENSYLGLGSRHCKDQQKIVCDREGWKRKISQRPSRRAINNRRSDTNS